MNKRINNLAKKIDEEMQRNVIRDLRNIAESKKIHFIDVLRTYTKFVEENAVGEVPDVLYFNRDAYEKTKQYYLK